MGLSLGYIDHSFVNGCSCCSKKKKKKGVLFKVPENYIYIPTIPRVSPYILYRGTFLLYLFIFLHSATLKSFILKILFIIHTFYLWVRKAAKKKKKILSFLYICFSQCSFLT